MAAAISASVRVPYVVDLKVIVFVSVTVLSPFINTIAESCVRGLRLRSMLWVIPVIGPVIVVSALHQSNTQFISIAFEVSQPDTSNEVRPLHPLNIDLILITFEVLKLDKFNEVRLEQPANINPILVTDEVLKLDKSNEVSFSQLLNMELISVTLEVSKLDTSNEVRLEQSLNILFI